jgi:D-3-phosphoglycerate dehydrogenase/(S)-sulfolactate dehydrogenase
LEDAGFHVRYPAARGQTVTEPLLRAALSNVEAVVAGPEPYSAQLFQDFPGLRAICRAGVGYDAVDVPSATSRGIAVGITPGTNHDAVAEHTFALLLAVAKRIVECHDNVISGGFDRRVMQPLRGRTLGIFGLGRIGKAVAVRAQSFGMAVIAFDPYADRHTTPDGVHWVSFEKLLAQSDYLTLHAPLTPETRHVIDASALAKMKPSAILINTSRGGLVNEHALSSALVSGRLAGAGIDVYEHEPPVGSALLTSPSVVLTPHVAGIDADAVEQMAVMAAQTIVDLYRGLWPADRLVNAAALGPNWKW